MRENNAINKAISRASGIIDNLHIINNNDGGFIINNDDGTITNFIGIINNGLNLIGMDTYIQSIVKGAIILIAVAIVSRSTKLNLL